jgi:hypothetical protein
MALRAKRLTLPDLANRAAKLEPPETFVALRVSFVSSVLKISRRNSTVRERMRTNRIVASPLPLPQGL